MKRYILLILISLSYGMSSFAMSLRGVVYDVGLKYTPTSLSAERFDTVRVAYDMNIISRILRCNSVRIEGDDVDRIVAAARIASREGLKVFFNPWRMGETPEATARYLRDAAKKAEALRLQGYDITFVAGCEYTLFSKGVFPGDTFDERFQWFMNLWADPAEQARGIAALNECNLKLNAVLADICREIRREFKGAVSYASGTWETVDWSLFDIVGIDYYRRGENEEDYAAGLNRYKQYGKPVVVMEVGCCPYVGASKRGGEAFAIFQGVAPDGTGIYEGGEAPERSEKEQADYIEDVIRILDENEAQGVFIFVFAYPIYPYRKTGLDQDLVSYALVKSFPENDVRNTMLPAWEPKEAFYRLGEAYSRMQNKN